LALRTFLENEIGLSHGQATEELKLTDPRTRGGVEIRLGPLNALRKGKMLLLKFSELSDN
jgi:hypothetical protein